MSETGLVRANHRTRLSDIIGVSFRFSETCMLCVFIRIARSSSGDSNEYPQYTSFTIKKEIHPPLSQICSYGILFKGTQEEVRNTAVVNEPSVFEPFKFYCRLLQRHLCCLSDLESEPVTDSLPAIHIFIQNIHYKKPKLHIIKMSKTCYGVSLSFDYLCIHRK